VLVAAPGQADRVQGYLTAIKKYSLSEQEPGCLDYRTVRSFVIEGGETILSPLITYKVLLVPLLTSLMYSDKVRCF
jgi:hypothetical protein